MFGYRQKLQDEMIMVLEDFRQGNYQALVALQSNQKDQKLSESLNVLLDDYSSLRARLDSVETSSRKVLEDTRLKVELLNNIPTPVMAVDKDFNVIFMNASGAVAVGRTSEGCLGEKCYDLFNTKHCKTEA